MKAFIFIIIPIAWLSIYAYITRNITINRTFVCGCTKHCFYVATIRHNNFSEYLKLRMTGIYNCGCGRSTAIYTQRGQYRNTREVGK